VVPVDDGAVVAVGNGTVEVDCDDVAFVGVACDDVDSDGPSSDDVESVGVESVGVDSDCDESVGVDSVGVSVFCAIELLFDEVEDVELEFLQLTIKFNNIQKAINKDKTLNNFFI
jgi:hypothetical protein